MHCGKGVRRYARFSSCAQCTQFDTHTAVRSGQGRKDKLYKNLAAMRRSKGSAFDLVPR